MLRPNGHPEVLRGLARPPAAGGLRRVRLVNQMLGADAVSLTLVTAPAGCGKTTLLSHVGKAVGRRLAWLTLTSDLAPVAALLDHLREAFDGFPGITGQPWHSVHDMVNGLDGALPDGAVLVLDDLHAVAGAPSLGVIRALLIHQPPGLTLVFGGRSVPQLGLSRHRLTSSVRDIGPDDLRFRTWEVEELFRTCHDVRLGSGEAARLTQCTSGWAAALQLFHLATTGRPRWARDALLAGVGGGRLSSQYLAEQILAQLPGELLDFTLRSSVLDRLTPQRCDRLLGIRGSGRHLTELDRAGLLDSREDVLGGTSEYRYHEVLQTHLLGQLDSRLGSPVARELHRQAARGWRAEAAHADAVRSLCRAQDWDGVQDVIAEGGHHLADDRGNWLDLLPASLHRSDPWVALASARRLLSDGALRPSLAAYARAIEKFGGLSGVEVAAREMRALRTWVEPPLGTVDDPYHLLRLAVIDPRLVPLPTDRSSVRWCAYATACVVAGRLTDAATGFDLALRQPGLTPTVETVAVLGHALALSASGDPGAPAARRRAGAVAAAVGLPSLERWSDGLIRLFGQPAGEGTAVIDDLLGACRSVDDTWGEALLLLFATMRGLAGGHASAALADAAAGRLTALPAPALAVWASAAEAIASAQAGDAHDRESLAVLERTASAVGPVPHALALTATALSTADPAAAARARRAATALVERPRLRAWLGRMAGPAEATDSRSEASTTAEAAPAAGVANAAVAMGADAGRAVSAPGPAPDVGLAAPSRTAGGPPVPVRPTLPGRREHASTVRTLRVDVLGSLSVTVDGEPVATDGLRPLHRELLAVFAVFANRTVQRDQLLKWFWPVSSPARAQHSLQVAVSALRRLPDPIGARNSPTGLRRDGTGYRLQLPTEQSDARRLEALVRDARQLAALDPAAAITALEAAVALYRGELVPEIGYPEWILEERERLHLMVTAACELLTSWHADAGNHRRAVAAARAGLIHDRHRDGLWRQLVTSLGALDQPAAAAAARRSYDDLLADLGTHTSR